MKKTYANGMLFRIGPVPGTVLCERPPDMPDMSAGDAQFLDRDPERIVQIRPRLMSERITNDHTPRTHVVVLRPRPDDDKSTPMYAFVRLPPFERQNTRANAAKAIRRIIRFDPALGRVFSDAVAAAASRKS